MCNSCGCCEPKSKSTPIAVANRPGLPEIAYRVGTYPTFRQAMVQAIASYPELAGWRTRASDDYGIGVMEMWAYVGDILTFYQERIANEAYLGTAVWRESVLRLGDLLNYRPAAGMAATAYLAFTADKDKSVVLAKGLLVQSVPASADDKPQKFETMEALTAHATLNQFRVYPKPAPINPLQAGRTSGVALGDISHLANNDKIVVYEEVVIAGKGRGVASAVTGLKSNVAQVAQANTKATLASQVTTLAQPASAFLKTNIAQVNLVEKVGLTTPNTGFLFPSDCKTRVFAVEDKEITDIASVDWQQKVTWTPAVRCTFGTKAVLNKWTRKFRLFGHDAPDTFFSVSVDANGNTNWQSNTFDFTLNSGNNIKLAGIVDDLKDNTELLFVAQLEGGGALVQRATVVGTSQVGAKIVGTTGGASASQSTVTQIALANNLPVGINVRTAVVYELEGGAVALWGYEYPAGITGNEVYVPLVEWDTETALAVGRRVIVGDGEGNLLTTTIVETSEENDHLVLELDKAIAGTMNSSTATAYGNVAKATHGETVSETLGSGDAAHPFLTFSLKKSPLTHVPQAGAPHGAGSTLQVRVDGVLWTETPDFYGQEETARIFISRADNEGEVTVTFGDGKTGATPPTGNGNVTAVYRQGIGQVGNVNAGTLTTLLKKPLGLKKAMNPAPAEGGSEPESVEQIRENAPNTVRTFGRVVSLTDFADAAREYAGIAKARADWYWNDLEQVVRLTVAGDAGAVITTGGETHTNLVADLNSRRDPNRGMMVVSHVPVAVTLVVNIQVDVAYIAEDVQASVRTALLDYFAFDNLDLGQPIHLSDLYRVIHTVTGVVAADIDNLNFKLTAGTPSKNHLAIAPNEIATMAEADLIVNLGLAQ